MTKLSNGMDSTLGSYRRLAKSFFGDEAVAFIDKKIAESPKGEAEEVIADERQMIMLLSSLKK